MRKWGGINPCDFPAPPILWKIASFGPPYVIPYATLSSVTPVGGVASNFLSFYI